MVRRDHAKLIYDISEISGLFADANSLENFLQKIVELVALHMHCDVCSIYLYDEKQQLLTLKATQGLKAGAVDRVKLKLGEGLTGLAVKELRSVRERNASKVTGYQYFPDIGEEPFESFLAVPILRGQSRIGALVIQNTPKSFFNDNDEYALKAIASQLANTIESTKLLIELKEKPSTAELAVSPQGLKFIKGRVGAQGLAYGQAFIFRARNLLEDAYQISQKQSLDLDDFYHSVEEVEQYLLDLQQKVEERLSDVASLIFTAQILMLKDPSLIDSIVKDIDAGIHPAVAVVRTTEQYIRMFDNLPNQYLKEKREEVLDIGRMILESLAGRLKTSLDYTDKVVISRELLSSDILKLSSQKAEGVVILSGGITSHVSILARSLGIPLVIAEAPQLLSLSAQDYVLLDGEQGNVFINPEADVVDKFRIQQKTALKAKELSLNFTRETFTKDGERVYLFANINLLNDVHVAQQMKAEGIGLYRTEFPFIVRSNFPSEEEQYLIYKKLIDGAPGQEVTFRTLDIGGDKVLSYYDYEKERNPFLGMRSIRFSLKHKDVFKAQLKAILRAGGGANLRIMFPMISSLDEFREAKEIVLECIYELSSARILCHKNPQIGLMLELPSVIEIMEELAQEADFFSLGTNDFIQYMLAVDRTNEKVADLFLPHHPSILRAFKRIADVCQKYGKDLCVCGDMAHDMKYIKFFLGIGIHKFSLDPQYLLKVKEQFSEIEYSSLKKKVEDILAKGTVKVVKEYFA
ncbi:MAG: phosphoenolpyruvate--protein phosphotransferase [Candidatus Omnitrophica bacterium]|nr:phosphoenolpyruvate--protein phosphotransferase [Candidatus Omnitrophota bacterium]